MTPAISAEALDEHVRNGRPLADVMAAYETELVERGREAVVSSSGRNSMTVLDWEKLKDSPMFRHGFVGRATGEH